MSSGVAGIWAMRGGDYVAREFPGDVAGLANAIIYCGSNGVVQVYPVQAGQSLAIPPLPPGVILLQQEAGIHTIYGEARGRNRLGKSAAPINAAHYANIQLAIDAAVALAPAAGQYPNVYIPAGTYTPITTPAFTGITVPSGMCVYGDGSNNTFCHLNDTALKNTNLVTLSPGATGIVGSSTIEGIQFQGPAVAADNDLVGVGLKLHATNAAFGFVSGVIVRDCIFIDTASWGAYIASDTLFIDQMTFDSVTFARAARGGSMLLGVGLTGANVCTFLRCNFNGPGFGTYSADALQRGAVHIFQGSNVHFLGGAFQEVGAGTAISFSGLSTNIQIRDAHFENSTALGSADKHWITVGGGSVVQLLVDSCEFLRFNTAQGVQVLKVGATTGFVYKSCFSNSSFFTDKTVDNATDDIVLATATDEVLFFNCWRQHFITGGLKTLTLTGPTASVGRLFTDSRIRLPGLTNGALLALASPLTGDLAYDVTNNKLMFYNGASWTNVGTGL